MTNEAGQVTEQPSQRILVVDDDNSLLNLLKLIFEEEGFEVARADSGLQALQLMERRAPALIVLDLKLGDIHGLAVLRQIRKHAHEDLPVIVISGNDSLRQQALIAGADEFVSKPFDVESLVDLARARLYPRPANYSLTP